MQTSPTLKTRSFIILTHLKNGGQLGILIHLLLLLLATTLHGSSNSSLHHLLIIIDTINRLRMLLLGLTNKLLLLLWGRHHKISSRVWLLLSTATTYAHHTTNAGHHVRAHAVQHVAEAATPLVSLSEHSIFKLMIIKII